MNVLKALREKAGYTQIDVATKLDVGQSTVSMWENGNNLPRAEKLPLLAKLYGCSIDDLFQETDRPA